LDNVRQDGKNRYLFVLVYVIDNQPQNFGILSSEENMKGIVETIIAIILIAVIVLLIIGYAMECSEYHGIVSASCTGKGGFEGFFGWVWNIIKLNLITG
jgi:hypothetical protein